MKSRLIFILLIMIYVMSAPGAWPARNAEKQTAAEINEPPPPTPSPSADAGEQESSEAEKCSAEEKEIIARVVFAEARGECNEGQQAVAQVIFNRVNSPQCQDQDTVGEVVDRPGQFVIADTYTEKEMRNVEFVVENGFDMPEDVLYFATWNFRRNEWRKIGNHYFMR